MENRYLKKRSSGYRVDILMNIRQELIWYRQCRPIGTVLKARSVTARPSLHHSPNDVPGFPVENLTVMPPSRNYLKYVLTHSVYGICAWSTRSELEHVPGRRHCFTRQLPRTIAVDNRGVRIARRHNRTVNHRKHAVDSCNTTIHRLSWA